MQERDIRICQSKPSFGCCWELDYLKSPLDVSAILTSQSHVWVLAKKLKVTDVERCHSGFVFLVLLNKSCIYFQYGKGAE